MPSPPPKSPESPTAQLADPQPAPSPERFVMNKVEKTWILTQLTVLGDPIQKQKTLEKTCSIVANNAKLRHIPDAEIIQQQEKFNMSWRRQYMRGVKASYILYLCTTVSRMAKDIPIAASEGYDGTEGQLAAVRCGQSEDSATHLLDQAVMDYKYEASKRTYSSEDKASNTLARQQESRKEKRKRIENHEAEFIKHKRLRAERKVKKEQKTRATNLANIHAEVLAPNAAAASTAIRRRQAKQFGIFLNLWAQKNHLEFPTAAAPLPPQLKGAEIHLDPNLLSLDRTALSPSSGSFGDQLPAGQSSGAGTMVST